MTTIGSVAPISITRVQTVDEIAQNFRRSFLHKQILSRRKLVIGDELHSQFNERVL